MKCQRRLTTPTKHKTRRQTKQSKAKKNPPKSETQQKRKALNKTEKAKITLSIQETDVNSSIVPTVTKVVTAQSHVQSCSNKALFWEAFKDSGELIMGAIVAHLRDALQH